MVEELLSSVVVADAAGSVVNGVATGAAMAEIGSEG